MSEKLFEADFLRVDLRSILSSRQPATMETETTTDEVSSGAETNDKPGSTVKNTAASATITDWGEELKNRLKANRELSREARLPEFEIESKFFKEYFEANWKDPAVVKQLMLLGEPLKKALKVLGFSRKLNPILAFLKTKFAQELLKTKLLNINTFKAIYNAVAKRLVADSQFVAENDYNIIYCRDLYTKSPSEMIEYLETQQSILSPTASKYTAKDLLRNRKIFLKVANGPQDPAKYVAFVNKLDATALPSKILPYRIIALQCGDNIVINLKIHIGQHCTPCIGHKSQALESSASLLVEFGPRTTLATR